MKTCSRCKQAKPVAEFYRSSDKRDGLQSRCKACCHADTRKYRAEKPDKVREQVARYRTENRDRVLEINLKWRSANRERLRLEAQRYRKEQPEKTREAVRKYRSKNPSPRYDRLLNVPHDGWTREEILKRDGYTCTYCGDTEGPFHIDHIIPIAKSGHDTRDNVTTACVPCNLSKGSKLLHEWKP